MQQKTAVIFGGTGFIGRYIVRLMAERGWQVRVATRIPESAYFLKTAGNVGQITPIAYDAHDYNSIAQAVSGADFAVNCVGVLAEKGSKNSFEALHAQLPESIAAACSVAGVKRFVHISALGIEEAGSAYAASKRDGEKRLLKSFPKATILRPSVVFGEEDHFINQFAAMAQILPVLPLIGGGETKFQPIYVGDVAAAVMAALTISETVKDAPLGKVYSLGGPDVVSFKEVLEMIFEQTGKRRAFMVWPFWFAKIKAGFLQHLPGAPLTPDQVESLKTDSVVGAKDLTLKDLAIDAKAMSVIVPEYLERFRDGGRFAA